jgi:hypothetical protein
MSVKPHLNFRAIMEAMQKLSKQGTPFSGVCYRCTEPQFAGQIVSGDGQNSLARHSGSARGRFSGNWQSD